MEQNIAEKYFGKLMSRDRYVFETFQVFPCPSQPVTIVAALFGRASQIAKVIMMICDWTS